MNDPAAPDGDPPDATPRRVRFQILGPVRMWRGPREIVLGARQRRAMLALLLAHAGCPVSPAELVELLWGQEPPAHAMNSLHRHIGVLRRQWEPGLPNRAAGRFLVQGGGGYRLMVDGESLDLLRFRQLLARAKTEPPQSALGVCAEAFSCWQGPVAADLEPAVRAHPAFAAIEHEYASAVVDFARSALRYGQPRLALAALAQAAEHDPLDEAVQAQLILVLAASGKQAEAAARYATVRQRLADELGVDPGEALREAYGRVLRQEFSTVDPAECASGAPSGPSLPAPGPADAVPRPASVGAPGAVDTAPVAPPRPAQLPPDLPLFTGRKHTLAEVRHILANPAGRPSCPPVIAFDGMPGIGKTTLAIHLAHELIEDYPDGQLFLNLHGFDEDQPAVTVEEALRDLISGLGVDPRQIPLGRQAMTGLYRTLLHGRRVLVLLDNVRDSEQVVDLVPGSAGCLAIVTSRRRLIRLRTSAGAHLVPVELPSREEALSCLVRHIGVDRVGADREEYDGIINHCDRLPLALAIVGVRAASYPDLPLREIINELRQSSESLEVALKARTTGQVNQAIPLNDVAWRLRAVFAASYRLLSEPSARLFRLLSVCPGAEFTVALAASVGGVSEGSAYLLVRELQQSGLIREEYPGRYGWHNLVHGYATGLREEVEQEAEQRQVLRRCYYHYWLSAHQADLPYQPHLGTRATMTECPGVTPQTFPDARMALSWFDHERHTFISLIRHAADHGDAEAAWHLALVIRPYQQLRAHWQDWLQTTSIALEASVKAGDVVGQARLHHSVAGAHLWLGHHSESLHHLCRAQELYLRLGLTTEAAYVPLSAAHVLLNSHSYAAAIDQAKTALASLRHAGDRRGEADALWAISSALVEMGERAGVVGAIRAAITLFQQAGDLVGEGAAMSLLAQVYRRQDDIDSAVEIWLRCIALQRDAGDLAHLVEAYIALGECYVAVGRRTAAQDVLAKAMAEMPAHGPVAVRVRERISQLSARAVGL